MKKIEALLEKCINRVLEGKTPEETLRGFPEAEEELKKLLEAASQVSSLPPLMPSPDFETEMLAAIRNAYSTQEQSLMERLKSAFIPSSAGRALAAGFATLSMLGGIAYASQDALPGEPLYPVKRMTESVILIFTPDASSTTGLEIEQAGERIKEAEAIEETDPELSHETLGQAIESLNNVLEEKREGQARETITGLIEKMTAKQAEIKERKTETEAPDGKDLEPVIKDNSKDKDKEYKEPDPGSGQETEDSGNSTVPAVKNDGGNESGSNGSENNGNGSGGKD